MGLKTILKTTIVTLSLTFMVGCSGGSSSKTSSESSSETLLTITGVFVDNAVSGADYTCSSGATGLTNAAGEFTCNSGDKVSFSLGGIYLGTVDVSEYITPASFFPNNPEAALNLAQLLQSLDSDNNASNGIDLDATIVADFVAGFEQISDINFTSPTFDSDVNGTLPAGYQWRSEADAQQHLDDTFAALGIDSYGTVDTTATDDIRPIIDISNLTTTINENTKLIGKVSANEEVTFTLLNDGGLFTISSENVISFKVAPDYETSTTHNKYSFKILATDNAGNESQILIYVNVNNLDDTVPVLQASIVSLSETTPDGESFGNVVIDTAGDNPITSIELSGTGSDLFSCDADGKLYLSGVVDFETTSKYELQAIARSKSGNSASVPLTINITDFFNPFQVDIENNGGERAAGDVSGNYIITSDAIGGPDEIDRKVYVYKKQTDLSMKKIAEVKIADTDPTVRDAESFGRSLEINGNYFVVGTSSVAFVYKINSDDTVTLLASLHEEPISDFYSFGVSINGKYVAVNANYFNSGKSVVELYKINTDDTVSKFSTLAPEAGDNTDAMYFGFSISIFENYVSVGAYSDSAAYPGTLGNVYLYKINSDNINDTTLVNKFHAQNTVDNDKFGSGVKMNKEYIAVKASKKGYIFVRNSDTNITEVGETVEVARYAYSMDLSDGYFTLSVPDDDNTPNDPSSESEGSVYVYKIVSNSEVQLVKKLEASDSKSENNFGIVAAIDGKNLFALSLESSYLFDMEAINRPYFYNAPIESLVQYEMSSSPLYNFIGASPVSTLSYSLTGDDADKFNISGGTLSFNLPSDYETPKDVDVDNVYNFNVVAEDTDRNSASINVNVTVKDAHYLLSDKVEITASSYLGNRVVTNGSYVAIADTMGNTNVYNKLSNGTLNNIATVVASSVTGYNGVAMSGDYLVIGDSGYDSASNTDAGAIYVYKMTTDSISLISTIEGDSANLKLGQSLAIDGNRIVSNGHLYTINSENVNDTTLVTTFAPDDGESIIHYIANRLAIDGDYIAVGHSTSGDDYIGSTYVFKIAGSSVTQVAKLRPSLEQVNVNFGSSVTMNSGYLVVGSKGANTYSSSGGGGKAYLYKIDTSDDSVDLITEFQPVTVRAAGYFGSSISMDADYIVVGETGSSNENERVNLFTYDDLGVSYVQEIKIDTQYASSNYGNSISISNGSLIVGAKKENSNTGAAYFYSLDSNQP